MFQATMDMFLFELKRSWTPGRQIIWGALAVLPSMLMFLMQSQGQANVPDEQLVMVAFYLVAQVGCMLGLLLWATPAVGAELEGQTWIYLTLRSHGKTANLLGKYLVAVVWTVTAGWFSAAGVAVACGFVDQVRLMVSLQLLVLLGAICYAALYMLIGVLVHRRATVVAVVYTLIIEGVVSWVPATINQFTVCYRLRALLTDWIGLPALRSQADEIFGYEPAWQHVMCLFIYANGVLLIALWTVHIREYPIQSEV